MKNFECRLLKAIFAFGDKKRLKKDVVPQNVTVLFSNENYFEDGEKRHNFDVIVPKGREEEKLPAIINIHGGGFCAGTKEIYDNYARRMAAEGFVVININYSLAPKYPFPHAIEDCVQAINYCLSNREKYHMADEYFVMGDSAGANLAATMGIIATNPEYAELMKLKISKRMKGIYLSCGCYMLVNQNENGKKSPLELDVMYFQKKRGNFPDKRKYEILESVTEDFPPTFITSCSDDFLYKDNVAMKKKLDALCVKNVALFFDSSHEPLGHVFNYRYISDEGKVFPEAEEAKRVSTEFFKALSKKGE